MPATSSYLYCPKNTAPDGPYDTGPNSSPCNTSYTVRANWPSVKQWKLDIKDCTFQLNGYIYNATQRGTYYYQFDGSGTMTADSASPCATGNDDRTFRCTDCITAKYKFIPCCEETICNSYVNFYRARTAQDTLSFDITMNSWVVDPAGQTNKKIEPNIYWDVPSAVIGQEGGTKDSLGSDRYGGPFPGGASIGVTEMTPYLSFYPCFNIPVQVSTEYGCTGYYINNGVEQGGGYDCFGAAGGNFDGETLDGGEGYWQLNGAVWTYTTDWYWENTHGTWKCGKCTYCKGTKGGCSDCTPCTPDTDCNGDDLCSCSTCRGDCRPDGSEDVLHDQPAGCYPQSCDYHDLWQKGHFVITLTPGSNDPTRCVS
jgi:hypothetical protein